MNTKKRILSLYNIAPEYPRIPHLHKSISNMTHDDIQLETPIEFPLEAYVQEKVDGANLGVSWISSAIIRNRNNILKKGYIEKGTPSKLQFRPSWNWAHDHNKDIQWLSKELMSTVTVYGEWMYAQHSIGYDNLPDWFLAYDIWVAEERKFLAINLFEDLISQTKIKYIKPKLIKFNSVDEIIRMSELKSDFRNGVREGIVIKQCDEKWVTGSFKIVNNLFQRRINFNDELIKNKIKK